MGQAIRISQIEGLHTQLPEEELDPQMLLRCRNLWWTLYIMDRHFSSSIGLPVIIKDYDTTALAEPPDSCTQEDVTLSLQVKMAQLLSTILTSESMLHYCYFQVATLTSLAQLYIKQKGYN